MVNPTPEWAYSPIQGFPLIPSSAFDSLGSVVAYPGNAAGDGVTDDTSAIKGMFQSGARVFDLLGRWYKISIPEGSTLASFVGKSGIRVFGRGGGFIDARNYVSGTITTILLFDGCSDVVVDCNYIGQPLPSPADAASGIGYRGATFVSCINGCNGVQLYGDLRHLRYGMQSGDYADPTKGYNTDLFARINTYRCGYPVAHYLANNAHSIIHCEDGHRAAYYAGVNGGSVRASVKNQYIAPVQVLVTDAKTGSGESRGSAHLDIDVIDRGTTYTTQELNYLAGISLSRVDPGTVYENLNFRLSLTATEAVASNVGGFILNSTVTAILPGQYSADWSSQIKIRDVTVSGTLDRTAKTTASNVYDLYIRAEDPSNPENNPAVSRITFNQFRVLQGSGGSLRALYAHAPALTDRVNFIDCELGSLSKDFSFGAKPINYIGTP